MCEGLEVGKSMDGQRTGGRATWLVLGVQEGGMQHRTKLGRWFSEALIWCCCGAFPSWPGLWSKEHTTFLLWTVGCSGPVRLWSSASFSFSASFKGAALDE